MSSATQTTGKKENKTDEENKSKSAATDQRATEIKSAATEHEHQDNQNNQEIHAVKIVRLDANTNGVFTPATE